MSTPFCSRSACAAGAREGLLGAVLPSGQGAVLCLEPRYLRESARSSAYWLCPWAGNAWLCLSPASSECPLELGPSLQRHLPGKPQASHPAWARCSVRFMRISFLPGSVVMVGRAWGWGE